MRPFEIENVIERLTKSNGSEFIDPSSLTGGSEKVQFIDQLEIHKPVFTRNICSIYEYTLVLTTLAKMLHDSKDISKYVDIVNANTLINPAHLAFLLISSGKMNATLIRNYRNVNEQELVSLSELIVNPEWEDRIRSYYLEKEKSMTDELYSHLIPDSSIL